MENNKLQEWLLHSITQRFRSKADLELGDYVFKNSLFHSIAPEQLEFMFAHREELFEYLGATNSVQELARHCIDSTKRYTYERNQFVNFTLAYDELLDAEYIDFIQRIRQALKISENMEELEIATTATLKVHHERLRLIMASYCITYQGQDLRVNPLLKSVPCEEYAAEFQLSILGLTLQDLKEPVLDIGCGQNGTLVRYLHEQGVDAYGVDRIAPQKLFFTQSDWFNFDFAGKPWGSILAHQSLSTHFIYAYLNLPVNIEKFSRFFVNILEGLETSSFLCYAPGLPFFEKQLEVLEQYTQEHHPISLRLPEVEQIAYSTKITKIA